MNATEQAIVKLTAGLEMLTSSVEQLREDLRESHAAEVKMAACMGQMQQSQVTLNEGINSLVGTVRDGNGNGQPSLMQRVSQLESEHKVTQHMLATMSAGIVQLTQNISNTNTQLAQHTTNVNTARIMSRGQIIAGVLGMFVTAAIAGVTLYFTIVPTK